MKNSRLSPALGALFIVLGILVPTSTLISILRDNPPTKLLEQLLLGARLFKINLIILGLFIVVLSRLSIWKPETKNKKFSPNSSKKWIPIIMVVILAVSLALRLYKINFGLWLDEILTYVSYARMSFGEIVTTYDSLNQHFLYSLLAHSSFLLFGESALALRLPAAFFGVGSIWLLYLFGSKISNTREALLSAALLTFSYHHIWFSQDARGYTGLLFWTLLSSWIFLQGLREARSKIWLLYALSATLGVYTHPTMLFVIFGHFVIYLGEIYIRRKENWQGRWIGFYGGFCLTGLLTIQLYSLVLPQIFSNIAEEKSIIAAWNNPFWTLIELIKGINLSFSSIGVAIGAIFVFGVGVYGFFRKNPVLIYLMFIPALLCAVAVIGMAGLLYPRFLFFIIGFCVLVLVRGVMLLGSWTTRFFHFYIMKSNSIGVVLCIGLIFVSAWSVPKVYAPKQDYLGALKFVEENTLPGDMVVTVGLSIFPYKQFYNKDWEVAETSEDLRNIRSRSERTWLLYTIPTQLQYVYPSIMADIQRDFEIVKRFYGTLGDGTIFVCLSENSPSVSSRFVGFRQLTSTGQ